MQNLWRFQLRPWWPLLPAAGALWVGPPTAARRLAGLAALFAAGWLLIISLAKTKLEWYPAPILPPLALVIGLGLGASYHLLGQRKIGRPAWQRTVAGVGLSLLLILPYGLTIRRLLRERHNTITWGSFNSYGTYLRQYPPPPLAARPVLVYWPTGRGAAWAFTFYQETAAARKVALTRCDPDSLPPALAPGTRVLVCVPQLRTRLLQRYAVRLLDQREVCSLYEVRGAAKP